MKAPTVALDGPNIVVRLGHRQMAFANLAEAVRRLPPARAAELLDAIERHMRSALAKKRVTS